MEPSPRPNSHSHSAWRVGRSDGSTAAVGAPCDTGGWGAGIDAVVDRLLQVRQRLLALAPGTASVAEVKTRRVAVANVIVLRTLIRALTWGLPPREGGLALAPIDIRADAPPPPLPPTAGDGGAGAAAGAWPVATAASVGAGPAVLHFLSAASVSTLEGLVSESLFRESANSEGLAPLLVLERDLFIEVFALLSWHTDSAGRHRHSASTDPSGGGAVPPHHQRAASAPPTRGSGSGLEMVAAAARTGLVPTYADMFAKVVREGTIAHNNLLLTSWSQIIASLVLRPPSLQGTCATLVLFADASRGRKEVKKALGDVVVRLFAPTPAAGMPALDHLPRVPAACPAPLAGVSDPADVLGRTAEFLFAEFALPWLGKTKYVHFAAPMCAVLLPCAPRAYFASQLLTVLHQLGALFNEERKLRSRWMTCVVHLLGH